MPDRDDPPATEASSSVDATAARIRALAAAGFDLVTRFDPRLAPWLVELANRSAARETSDDASAVRTDASAARTDPSAARTDASAARTAWLVGNTRALWAPFSAALRDPALASEADPLDRYTERTLEELFPHASAIFYAHRRYEGAFLPLQQVAVATGLAALAPTHLLVHPVHGPWIALRAVVLVEERADLVASDRVAPHVDPDGLGPAPEASIVVSVASPIAKPCRCDGRCEAAFARALAAGNDRHLWLAVRDACSLRGSRYSDEQIEFHYSRAFRDR